MRANSAMTIKLEKSKEISGERARRALAIFGINLSAKSRVSITDALYQKSVDCRNIAAVPKPPLSKVLAGIKNIPAISLEDAVKICRDSSMCIIIGPSSERASVLLQLLGGQVPLSSLRSKEKRDILVDILRIKNPSDIEDYPDWMIDNYFFSFIQSGKFESRIKKLEIRGKLHHKESSDSPGSIEEINQRDIEPLYLSVEAISQIRAGNSNWTESVRRDNEWMQQFPEATLVLSNYPFDIDTEDAAIFPIIVKAKTVGPKKLGKVQIEFTMIPSPKKLNETCNKLKQGIWGIYQTADRECPDSQQKGKWIKEELKKIVHEYLNLQAQRAKFIQQMGPEALVNPNTPLAKSIKGYLIESTPSGAAFFDYLPTAEGKPIANHSEEVELVLEEVVNKMGFYRESELSLEDILKSQSQTCRTIYLGLLKCLKSIDAVKRSHLTAEQRKMGGSLYNAAIDSIKEAISAPQLYKESQQKGKEITQEELEKMKDYERYIYLLIIRGSKVVWYKTQNGKDIGFIIKNTMGLADEAPLEFARAVGLGVRNKNRLLHTALLEIAYSGYEENHHGRVRNGIELLHSEMLERMGYEKVGEEDPSFFIRFKAPKGKRYKKTVCRTVKDVVMMRQIESDEEKA
jgi:hypothetical protein